MTGKSIGAAERDDSEGGSGLAGLRDKALEYLMDGAVAPAGKDDVCTAENCLPGLDGGGAGGGSGYAFDTMA